jgi:hypothetical protein
MSVSNLTSVVSTGLISTISKAGGSSSSASSPTSSKSSEPISVTLQRGAQGCAASIQYLNGGISYLNIASEFTNKLLDVVDALDTVVSKASKGNIEPGDAKRYKEQFDKFSRAYDDLVKGAVVKGRDLLSIDDMSNVLKRGGLDPDKVDELAVAFKKITSFSGANVSSNGAVTAGRDSFSVEKFYRAVTQATRDPEEPDQGDDGSGSFNSIKVAIKGLKKKVMDNLDALKTASDLVGKNMELVRATGFAFLNASNTTTSSDDPDVIASQLRNAIRSTARGSISEVHNLQAILSAGLLSIKDAGSGSGGG